MKYLLDTHTLIWFVEKDKQLSSKVQKIIEDTANEIFVSSISLLEIAIKIKIGKLAANRSLSELILETQEQEIQILPVTTHHILNYLNLPLFDIHRDPFDRTIIAQAHSENLKILSRDVNFQLYKEHVEVLW